MYKLIAIIGQSGSGKDTIFQNLLKMNHELHPIIRHTTRPLREGEVEGVNYYFTDKNCFADRLLNNEFLEVACFNNWFYGTCYESLRSDSLNIGVFDPSAIEQLVLHKDIDLTIFYIKASDKNRLLRTLNREENPNVDEIVRRFLADKKDFQDLDFQMYELQNNTLDDLNSNLKFIQARIEELQDKTY